MWEKACCSATSRATSRQVQGVGFRAKPPLVAEGKEWGIQKAMYRFKCLVIQIYEFLVVRIFKFLVVQTYMFLVVQIHEFLAVQFIKFLVVQIHKFLVIQVPTCFWVQRDQTGPGGPWMRDPQSPVG